MSGITAIATGVIKMEDAKNDTIDSETYDKITSDKRLKGVITTVNVDRGFGFIACQSDGRDYFFHHSEVLRGSVSFKTLAKDDVVSFYPEENPDLTKGPKAQAVKLIKRANVS